MQAIVEDKAQLQGTHIGLDTADVIALALLGQQVDGLFFDEGLLELDGKAQIKR